MLQCSPTVQEEGQTTTQVRPLPVKEVSQQSAPAPGTGSNKDDNSQTSTQKITAFAPHDWYLLVETEGDLNGDSRPDTVAVFSKSNPQARKYDENQNEEDLEAPRLLIIALRDNKDHLQRAGKSNRAVLCRRCGGMLDEPLIGLSIKGGTVVLEQESLATSDISYKHMIRYQDGRWLVSGEVKLRDRRKGTTQKVRQEKSVPLSEFDIIHTSRAQE